MSRCFVVASLLLCAPVPALAALGAGGRLDPALAGALAVARPDERLPVLVVLEPPPGGAVPAPVAGGRAAIALRARARLHAAVDRMRPMLGRLARRGDLARLEESWAAMALGAEATPAAIAALASQPGVRVLRLDRPRPALVGAAGASSWRGRITLPEEEHGSGIDGGVVRTGAPKVWERFGWTGRGVVVAVIDSGVCLDHPGIAGRIWVNPGEDRDGDGEVFDPDDLDGIDDDGNGFVDDLVGWDFADDDPLPDDASGHGSHVAGTIAGDGGGGFRAGMAPGARVMVLRVPGLSTREIDVFRALEYAALMGADVANLSLGWRAEWGPDRATWRRVVETVTSMGMTVVAAAGNEGWGREPVNVRTPADVPAALAVGATDPFDRPAVFSSRGPVSWQDVPGYRDHPYPPGLAKPDLAAPGVDTRSHALCEGTGDASGTSMAAPHVSGAAALLLEADPRLGPAELRDLLVRTAVDIGPTGPDPDSGAGRIDVLAAAEAVRPPFALEDWRFDDGARAGRGDADGVAEPGERLALTVTLRRVAPTDGESVRGTLVVLSGPAVAVVDRARWGRIPAGTVARQTTPFEVELAGRCGARTRFALDVTEAGGRRSRLFFELRSGRPVPAVLFADDAERDRGWRIETSARSGAFVRVEPVGTFFGGRPANPGRGAGSTGTFAWVTGNGGGGGLADDLDGGTTTLISPPLDAGGFVRLELSWWRWFVREGLPGLPALEGLVAEASADGGETWLMLDAALASDPAWRHRSVALEKLFDPLPAELLLRFRAAAADAPDVGEDVLIEAGVDEILLAGERAVCD